MKLLRLLLPLALAAAPAAAQDRPAPRLVVAIVVDQLSADMVREYRPHFTGGLARVSQGTVFAGHHGQGANVPALGDYMKRADPSGRVVAVSGSDQAGTIGGRAPDQRWWWSGRAFVGEGRGAARSVGLVNANVATALARPRPPLAPPEICRVLGDASPEGSGRFARAAGDVRAFRISPELDGATLALAAGLRAELGLGAGEAADLLVIALSATHHVRQVYGAQGPEMCLQLLSLDRSLGDFFRLLDSSGVDYEAVLAGAEGEGAPAAEVEDDGRHVQILFWRQGIAPSEGNQAVGTAGIVPRVAAMLGLTIATGSIDGLCLEVAATRCSAP
jgi:hypothetical protein